jgi:Tfp pilus assembly protein PilN
MDGGAVHAGQLADYGTVIGAALAGLLEAAEVIQLAGRREVRLSPRREQVERVLAQPKRWAIVAAALTLLVIVLHVGAMRLEAGRMRAVLAEANKTAGAGKEFQQKLQAMQRLQTYRVDVEKTVAALAAVVPDTIVLSSIQMSRESRMVVKGTAKDPKAVFALADALRKSKRFQDVNWDRAEQGQGGTFTISMEVAGVSSLNPSGPRGGKWH